MSTIMLMGYSLSYCYSRKSRFYLMISEMWRLDRCGIVLLDCLIYVFCSGCSRSIYMAAISLILVSMMS